MVWVAAALVAIIGFAIAPRVMFGLIVIAVLGVSGVVGYAAVDKMFSDNLRDKVRVSAKINEFCKDPAFPISVGIFNSSNRTVEHVSFRVIAKRAGYSNSVYDGYYETDKIIKPKETFASCWSTVDYSVRDKDAFRSNLHGLEWDAETSSVRFAK